ncbi:DUF885 domain-containing protein [Hyphococcus flavus]|uniref:DUF885 domain-containing protein n=1 Tax=Hyphococcus flavus TaxID=1866326 RepID=A0AAE9ZGM3_9PROT|nr:DUF885 domain-containing protein [Hyphococcus flavus]WDI32643.1 DUF885 domain-containing protein [Hyphococcus flavus]
MRLHKKQSLLAGSALAILMLSGCGERAAPAEDTVVSTVDEPTQEAAPTPASMLQAMLADHAQQVLRMAPEYATSLGVDEDIAGAGFNGRLGGYGFAANEQARSLNEMFLQEIRGFERDQFSGQDAITYDVLRTSYQNGARRNQFAFGGATPYGSGSPYVVTQLSGPHLGLPSLMLNRHKVETRQGAEDYVSRLNEFGRVFDETIETVSGDAALGVTPPLFAVNGAINSITGFTSSPPDQNVLATSFAARLENVSELSDEERADLLTQAVTALETNVYPAYARLSATLESLKAQAGTDAGIWRLGDEGTAFYAHALQVYGAGAKTADDVHQIGLDEVARITAEMDAILDAQGLTEGSVTERFRQIGAREDMLYPNDDAGRAQLLADLNVQVSNIMALAGDWFGTLPEQPVEVRRIPVYEQDSAPGGYYSAPPLDGSRPGIYWINLKNTADWPKLTLKTLTYHEAVPGHHFQRSLERAAGLPLIRNMTSFSEFSEGWALYAEQVAAEMGMFADDPMGDLGRLQSELFRSVRLVVDTGLHHKQWTREQAIEYMLNNTGRSEASITREVERYSVWPGQATSYKLGMLKMNELRKKAEEALGPDFDIREFHDEILLTGTMPMPVLERKIDAWIKEKQGA